MIKPNTTPPTGAYGSIRGQDAKTFRKDIASYDPKTVFFNKIWDACDFQKVALRPAVNFVDAMSGPGRLGLDLREKIGKDMPDKLLHFAFYFNDVANEPLMKLSQTALIAPCDVRELGKRFPVTFHVAAVRYGIKDLPQGQQKKALVALRESMVPGGRLVIADMTAYTEHAQQGVIAVHSTKQKLAGRDEATEARCHVPLLGEWSELVTDAGFQNVKVTFTGTSDVDTRQWAGQFGPAADDKQMIAKMNEMIRQTCDSIPMFQKEFYVSFNSEAVTLRFPIMVLVADKPA